MEVNVSCYCIWPEEKENGLTNGIHTRSNCLARHTVCSGWSNRNLLAFSASSKSKLEDSINSDLPASFSIHLVNLEEPWRNHSFVSEHVSEIIQLAWDSHGTRLLSADSNGIIKTWQMQDNFINQWKCTSSNDLGEGEHVRAVRWLDTSAKEHYIDSKCKDKESFFEKFPYAVKKTPFVRYGGRPTQAWIAITATGMIYVTVLDPVTRGKLRLDLPSGYRLCISSADVTYNYQDSTFLAATSSGRKGDPVQIFCIKAQTMLVIMRYLNIYFLNHYLRPIQLSAELKACINTDSDEERNAIPKDSFVDQVRFLPQDAKSAPALLVLSSGYSQSTIQLFTLTTEPVLIHSAFNNPNLAERDIPVEEIWSCAAIYPCGEKVSCFSFSTFPIAPSSGDADYSKNANSHIMLACQKGNLILLNRSSLSIAAFCNTPFGAVDDPLDWAFGSDRTVKSISFSPCGLCTAVINGRGDVAICRIRMSSSFDNSGSECFSCYVTLLEYCLTTGIEYWDILHSISATFGPSIDVVSKMIAYIKNDLSKQAQPLRESLQLRFAVMCAALYRYGSDEHGRFVDQRCRIILYCICKFLHFEILHKYQSKNTESNPILKLEDACNSDTDGNLAATVSRLEATEYVLNPGVIHHVRAMIDWIGNYALLLAATVSAREIIQEAYGVTDMEVVRNLRMLLLLVSTWGQGNAAFYPRFYPQSDPVPSLSTIYRILTKVWMCYKNDNKLDSIIQYLSDKDQLPSLQSLMDTRGAFLCISDRLLLGPNIAFFRFGENPSTEPNMRYDVIRLMAINPFYNENLRQCVRCGGLSMITMNSSIDDNYNWNSRWIAKCICGGSWFKL
ncbi:Mediator of RNA polymerase II transcription subunit 16 [Trichoplax sp. H2]|nr:Mediator of RNA polymerase II transcription subunit 16 [Trichoplax sp. H2]|eukprot:RDD40317.1 Mediator of RNA polymerase II transcription subunit 16 [Trichoplax sp. H2]